MTPAGRRRVASVGRVIVLVVLAMVGVVVPVWLVVVNSFKPLAEAGELSLTLPIQWQALENYAFVFSEGNYLQSFANSLVVTSSSIAISLVVGALAAWAFGRTASRVGQVLYYVAVMGVLLPPAIVPTVFLMRTLGIEGDYAAIVLFTSSTRLAVVIFLLTSFVRTLPRDMEEAAYVDGAKNIQVFIYVVVPLLKPALVAVFVILLIVNWNDFFGPFFLLHGNERATLPLSLYQFANNSRYQLNWHLIFAHLVLVSLPLVAVYLVAQRKINAGLMSGAVKG